MLHNENFVLCNWTKCSMNIWEIDFKVIISRDRSIATILFLFWDLFQKNYGTIKKVV